ncbi:hypothetical protein IAU60_000629 [Kwoniella sp. DSM 27419]
MRGCLAAGEMAAKGLAAGTGKRLIGVHHMQAHALTPLLTEPVRPSFPFLILLVSGGHTQLVLAKSQDKFEILLDTLDSKIGDAYEKAARVIQLPPHAQRSPGATLETYAAQPPLPPYDQSPLTPLPIPLSANAAATTRAFSFSGILSSLQRSVPTCDPTRTSSSNHKAATSETTSGRPLSEGDQRELSRIFQDAAASHLCLKLEQAIRRLPPTLRSALGGLVVSGGVASNIFLRERLKEMLGRASPDQEVGLFFPPIELCTDNAAMIAWTAILRLQAGSQSDPYDLPLRPKWSLEDLYDDVPA